MTTNNVTNNAYGQAIVQVQTALSGGSSTSSLTPVDITGSSVSITPTSASNKILINASFSVNVGATSGATYMYIQCLNGATPINGTPYTQIGCSASNAQWEGMVSFTYVDNPATTSSVTYKFQQYSSSGAITVTTSGVNVSVMEIVA